LPEEIVARARTLVTRRLLARRTGELEALSRIAQAALTAPSPELLLFRLVEIVMEVFNADVAVIYMLDEARAELRPRAAVGLPPGVEPAPIPLGVGAVATAMATREPVLVSDGAAGEPLTRREAFRSLMVAPLVGDELKHALNVIHQGASDSVETVRRLQEYSRPARVKGPEAVQLRDVLEQLLALTRPQWDNEAARRGIRYEIDFKADPAPA